MKAHVVLLLLLARISSVSAEETGLRAGAAKSNITPPWAFRLTVRSCRSALRNTFMTNCGFVVLCWTTAIRSLPLPKSTTRSSYLEIDAETKIRDGLLKLLKQLKTE